MSLTTPAYEPQAFKLPFPPDFEDYVHTSSAERFSALAGAAEAIFQLAAQSGQTIDIPEDAKTTSREVFAGRVPANAITTTAEGIHITALLNAYDMGVVQSAQQIRNFCTNILIETAGDKEEKTPSRLRAVEMLGKIADVGLFVERSTVLVANMSTDDIKTSLRDKLALLRAKMTDPSIQDVTFEEHQRG